MVTRKLKQIRQRFGVLAPRVVVRRHVSWGWYAFLVASFGLLMLVSGWFWAQYDDAGGRKQEVDFLHRQLGIQREELILLRSAAGTGENAVGIERAAQQLLLSRIKGLELENAALKEDMLLFERLTKAAGDAALIRVENFRVVEDSVGRFRYRLLLVYQSDKHSPEFHGSLQLLVSYRQGGRGGQLLLPERKEEMVLEVRHFLRREGGFDLPKDAVLVGVEARVFQGDAMKLKRMAQL